MTPTTATSRHLAHVEALRRAILGPEGHTPLVARVAAAAGDQTGTPTDAYLATVRTSSDRLGDADIEGLRMAGLTEDAIFELTIAAAFGESLRRFERAAAAVEGSALERTARP
jgi:hypothetical protein